MKPTVKKLMVSLALASPMALMVGCGDDVTKVNTVNPDTVAKLESKTCDKEGQMVYVESEKAFFVCEDEAWINTVKVAENISCTMKSLKDSSGYKVVCGGDSIGVVLNGKRGDTGKTGKSGDDGDDGDAGKATKGPDGKDGKAGTSCAVDSIGVDSLWVACGTTKAALAIPALESKTYTVKVQWLVQPNRPKRTQMEELQPLVLVEPLDSKSMLPIGESFQLDNRESVSFGEDCENYYCSAILYSGKIHTNGSRYARVTYFEDSRTLARKENDVSNASWKVLVDLEDTEVPSFSALSSFAYDLIIKLVKEGKSLKDARKQASSELYKFLIGKDENYSDVEELIYTNDSIPVELNLFFSEIGSAFMPLFGTEIGACLAESKSLAMCKVWYESADVPLSFLFMEFLEEGSSTAVRIAENAIGVPHCSDSTAFTFAPVDTTDWNFPLDWLLDTLSLYCDGDSWRAKLEDSACQKDLSVDTLFVFGDDVLVCDNDYGWRWRRATNEEVMYDMPCYHDKSYEKSKTVGEMRVFCKAGEWAASI